MKKLFVFGIALVAVWQLQADFAEDYAKSQALRFKPKEAKVILEKLINEKLQSSQRDQVLADLADISTTLKDYTLAQKYIEQIAEKPLQRYATLRFLNKKPQGFKQVPAEFGKEDFSAWPERLGYLGYYQRGMAYYYLGKLDVALLDMEKCIELTGSVPRNTIRLNALSNAGNICKAQKKGKQALDFYRQVIEHKNFFNSAFYLSAAINAAELLIGEKQYSEAEEILAVVKKTHRGFWQSMVFEAYGNLYSAQGKKQEAIDAYEKCINEKNGNKAAQKKAADALKNLSQDK